MMAKIRQAQLVFGKNSTIYAFEPVPQLYKLSLSATKGFKNIKIYPLALSDKNGTATFYVSEDISKPGVPSQSSSLLAPQEHLNHAKHVVFPKKITVNTATIDAWAENNNVDHIDLMWLDMQGHELSALKASTTILSTVKLIYTEVEFVKAYKGQALYKEMKEWLATQGFRVIALDFDKKQAAATNIPVGAQFYGNALFINERYYPVAGSVSGKA